jgi:hypothetical protein
MHKKILILISITSLGTLFSADFNSLENKVKKSAHQLVNAELAQGLEANNIKYDFYDYDNHTKNALKAHLRESGINTSALLTQIAFNELHAYCDRLIEQEN